MSKGGDHPSKTFSPSSKCLRQNVARTKRTGHPFYYDQKLIFAPYQALSEYWDSFPYSDGATGTPS